MRGMCTVSEHHLYFLYNKYQITPLFPENVRGNNVEIRGPAE